MLEDFTLQQELSLKPKIEFSCKEEEYQKLEAEILGDKWRSDRKSTQVKRNLGSNGVLCLCSQR